MGLDTAASVFSVTPSSRGEDAQAARREPPAIARYLKKADISDPWEVLEAAVAEPVWAAWSDRARQRCFVAAGEVVGVRAGPADRFAQVRDACSTLTERLLGDRDDLPFALGGFAFTADATEGARFFVPREIVASQNERVVRIAHRREGATPSAPLAPRPPRPSASPALRWRSEPDARGYRERVEAALAAMTRGELAKVVLARRSIAELEGGRFHPAAILRALREQGGAIVFGFGFGDRVFLGATPETLAECRSGRLHTHAVAGTGDPAHLLASEKDRREHAEVVTDIAAALAPIARGLRIAESPSLLPAGRLTHLCTPIEAELDAHLLDAVAALHPTAALAGTPRPGALAFLRAHEPCDRGWYGAPVGYLAPSGNGVFAVAIRSALVAPTRVEAWAGAGIVPGSDPEREWCETEQKLGTIRHALREEAS